MKKTIFAYFIVSLFLLAPACQRVLEEDVRQDNPAPEHTLNAFLEGNEDTKTQLSEPDDQGIYYPFWSKGDALALYADDIPQPDTYTLSSGEGTVKGSFKGTLFGSRMVALYPASDKTEEGLKGNVLTLELPATQQYVPGSFGPGAFPMVAVSTDGDLSFKNLCAVLKVSLTGDESVRSIKFIASDGWKVVSGKGTVRTDFTDLPELVMADEGSNEVSLECGSVDLNPDTPTDFFLVIPAGTYNGGFTVEIQTYHGVVTRSTAKDVTFGRSQFRSIPAFECKGTGEVDPDNLPYNEIWYKTSSGYLLGFSADEFDAGIVSNTLEDGWGILRFDGPVKVLGNYTFSRTGVVDVRLPDSVETLGNYSFYGSSITSFRTPANLVSLGGMTFTNCTKLQRFYGKWATGDGRFIQMENGTLVAAAHGGLEETVRIPEGAVALGEGLFMRDESVRHVIIPEGVTDIGSSCFAYCSNLETLTLPSTMATVGSRVFYQTPNLQEFKGDSEMIIGNGKALQSNGTLILYIGNEEDWTIPEGVNTLANSCIADRPNLRSLTFPNSLSELYTEWYVNCPKLEFFYGPKTSEDHHCLVFYGNYLVAVTPVCPATYSVPDDMGITRIFYTVFCGNTTIEHLSIPDEVYQARDCFYEMPNLKTLRLGTSVQDLGSDPFSGNTAMEALYLRSFSPPTFSDSDAEWALWGTDNLVIYVPKGFENQYREASGWSKYADRIQGYVYEDLENPDYYMSTDYSRDGGVTILQTASEGAGINLVLMGDAYSDREIADGTYATAMRKMMDAFFSEEPYTTYQNLFNVYAIDVVSATEGYDHGGQALSGYFGQGTEVGGNDNKCMEYAQLVVPSEQMGNTLIIVAMNRDYYAGTCWMYYPSSGDYGGGLSVAYFPTSSDIDTFNGLVRHEAGGHGFSKLADEYAYESMGTIPQSEIDNRNSLVPYGWWKNADFTGDPTEVKWARFLADERYQYDGLGCFEGAFTYWKGAWRPTDNSIMRHNTDGFNAPSREAIWYRMHKLAYGDDWQYNYEDFVAYDAKNRKTQAGAPAPSRRNFVERPMEPTHAPIVVPRRWDEPSPAAHARRQSRLQVQERSSQPISTADCR